MFFIFIFFSVLYLSYFFDKAEVQAHLKNTYGPTVLKDLGWKVSKGYLDQYAYRILILILSCILFSFGLVFLDLFFNIYLNFAEYVLKLDYWTVINKLREVFKINEEILPIPDFNAINNKHFVFNLVEIIRDFIEKLITII